MKPTIQSLQTEVLAANAHRDAAERRAINAESNLNSLTARMTQLQSTNLVLQSDRDRLTATIEVLSRRLASPQSESDPSRAGWRAANALPSIYDTAKQAVPTMDWGSGTAGARR